MRFAIFDFFLVTFNIDKTGDEAKNDATCVKNKQKNCVRNSTIECQKCDVGGSCRYGFCKSAFHDEMERCTSCKEGYYTDDCIICPDPALAFFSDALILGLGAYLLIAILYMVLLPSKAGDASNGDQARKGVKAAGLAGVLLNQLQIAGTVLSNIEWNPNVPAIVVKILKFIGEFSKIEKNRKCSKIMCVIYNRL